MKTCCNCKEEKVLTAFHNDKGKKDGKSHRCKECANEITKKWQKDNKEAYNEKNKNWRKDNEQYKSYHCARQNKRRADKLNATPKWADLEKIKGLYEMSRLFTKSWGEQYHVDHIIPLKGVNICGLHCEANLQVITATESLKKSNKFKEVSHF